ncbi:hypothetical protein B0H10DRAFT_1948344 [Mycena sp. CBHHK59/15]|nr:hypothetical protein B0H10DRAFT_1948344 [Mycena sp. CBHHK59/15]
MFVNQSDPKYQPKKHTVVNDDTIDPSIFEDETGSSHICFDEVHVNYRQWFLEDVPTEAAAQLEAYDNHRQRCCDIVLSDEKDFVMMQKWCQDWMQCQPWSLTVWDEGICHKEFEASCAWYFEKKVIHVPGAVIIILIPQMGIFLLSQEARPGAAVLLS